MGADLQRGSREWLGEQRLFPTVGGSHAASRSRWVGQAAATWAVWSGSTLPPVRLAAWPGSRVMCPGRSWLQLSQRHGTAGTGAGEGCRWQVKRLGLGMAAGRRWLWIQSTCLYCQRVGGTGSGRTGDLVQPSPRLLPSTIALLFCQCCSCLHQGLGLSLAGGQGEPAGSTHMGSPLCPESSELTPCRRAKL